MQKVLIALLALPCIAAAQQLPPMSNINARLQSLSASLNAVANQCALDAGALAEALEKAQQEISKLKQSDGQKPER